MGAVAGVVSAATSIYSAFTADDNADETRQAASQQNTNPWMSSGGRDLADRQLQLLMTDPTAAMEADPGYKSALMAAQRTMAKYGQDSGNMAAAAAQTGSNWYDNALRRLAGLAGATQMPAQGASASMQGMQAAHQMQGQGQASLGYGIRQLAGIFGGSGNTTPDGPMIWSGGGY